MAESDGLLQPLKPLMRLKTEFIVQLLLQGCLERSAVPGSGRVLDGFAGYGPGPWGPNDGGFPYFMPLLWEGSTATCRGCQRRLTEEAMGSFVKMLALGARSDGYVKGWRIFRYQRLIADMHGLGDDALEEVPFDGK